MSRKLNLTVPDIGAPDGDRPDGYYLNEDTGVPGTPILAEMKNDIYTFFSKMMSEGGVSYNNLTDTHALSQYYLSLEQTILRYSRVTVEMLKNMEGRIGFSVLNPYGYYEAGDVADIPTYIWDSASVLDDNGGSVIRPNSIDIASPGRWVWANNLKEVHVKWFGAKGDAVWNSSTATLTTQGTDDTTPIQNAIDTGLDVFYGGGVYRVTGTLTVRNQKLYGNRNTDLSAIYRYTVIASTVSQPIIKNDTADFLMMEIKNLRLVYDSTVTIDSNASGIDFTDQFPFNYLLENVEVLHGFYGLRDVSGSFQSNIKNCRFSGNTWNVYKIGGTTIKFDTVQAGDGTNGFYIEAVISATLINCASDNTTGGNTFKDIPAITIMGYDAEANTISNFDGLFYFDNCQGSFNGFTGVGNTISVVGAAPGALVYALNSKLDLSGFCPNHNKDVSNLVFTGDTVGGIGAVVWCEGSKVKLSGSHIQMPDLDAGSVANSIYTLYNVSASTGTLMYENSYIENDDANTLRTIELIPLGWGQTYNDVSSSRAFSTLYYNDTDRPMTLNVSVRAAAAGSFAIIAYIETIAVYVYSTTASGTSDVASVNIIIPAGYSYQIDVTNGTVNSWYELV